MLKYSDFRCGVTFAEVRRALAIEQREARRNGTYMYVTRATVLGRMHQLKQSAYSQYVEHHGAFVWALEQLQEHTFTDAAEKLQELATDDDAD